MNKLSVASEQGLYRPGRTILHEADPRVKVLSCLLLVILTFAAANWIQLAVLFATLIFGFRLSASPFSAIRRLCWTFRWLLLLTLLMHLLLSPGRTLWGTSWLSLDGFLTGIFVCLQMLMAVVASAVLGITTSTESLAGAFGWFVRPFQWFGFRTGEWQRLMVLALDFLPVIHEELHATRGSGVDKRESALSPAKQGRWTRWMQRLNDMLLRLVDRGDAIAHRLAMAEEPTGLSTNCSPLVPMRFSDWLVAGTMTLILIIYWVLN